MKKTTRIMTLDYPVRGTGKTYYFTSHHIHLGTWGTGKTAQVRRFIKTLIKDRKKNKAPHKILILDPIYELADVATPISIDKINSVGNGVFILKSPKGSMLDSKLATEAVQNFNDGTLIIENVEAFLAHPNFKYAMARLANSAATRNVGTYLTCQKSSSIVSPCYDVCTSATFSRLNSSPAKHFYNQELVNLAINCRNQKVMVDYSELAKKYKRLDTINKHGRGLELFQKVQVDFRNNRIVGIPEDIFCHTVRLQSAEGINTKKISGLRELAANLVRLSQYRQL